MIQIDRTVNINFRIPLTVFKASVVVALGRNEIKTNGAPVSFGRGFSQWAMALSVLFFFSMVIWITLKHGVEVWIGWAQSVPSQDCLESQCSSLLACSLANSRMVWAANGAVFYLFVAFQIWGSDQNCQLSLVKQKPVSLLMSLVSYGDTNCNLNNIYLYTHIQIF